MGDYVCGDDDFYYYESEDDQDESVELQRLEYDTIIPKHSVITVITKESLLAAQREDLRNVMEVLSLKEHHARTLLIHYRWDVDNLLTILVEKGKDELYSKAGVTSVEHDNSASSNFLSMVRCIICIEEVPADKVTTMDCGHYFCNNCWTEYFIIKINEGQSRRITCMEHQCDAICDEEKVRTLVNARDSNLAEKFDRFLLESYIEDNRKVKWCPSVPHCGNAIRIEDNVICEVECACGLQFCFNCLCEAHSPCPCFMWELWAKKCRDDSETVNWITVNTKHCPKCHKLVEKNGGCNLVSCICGQPFCWLCGEATGRSHTYTTIAGHSCGRYKEETKEKTERAKKDLFRYIHYHNRYKAHTDSLDLETKLQITMQEKISAMEEKDAKERNFSWLTNGLSRLSRSRQILAYSYAFAFYMFGEESFNSNLSAKEKLIKLNLFEDQQQKLEENVEILSSFLEEPFDTYSADKFVEVRIKILDFSRIVDNICKKLYECIENDLLGSLLETFSIAPYKSAGVDKALELVC
ncbi:probable E3 ubiquitin-protein ligase ARI1 [Humulus lupulus]|uniref:probable E3 ubiquitin-protein ligase ARI1 n=1 Tax=Humulus lupulus TaxID=3486 RepID=UPI002B40A38E|nr:probable E3 ubiquitin-protein ligase ARI1 [Humulus lupulus]XP_062090526.1 probable E3 ubiquitin-protein ligase ARI1 [Humulus lupulus]XP_062090527.1 probable E3 ubiquitin-protein ligase ARI1 [Humulus lupulus]